MPRTLTTRSLLLLICLAATYSPAPLHAIPQSATEQDNSPLAKKAKAAAEPEPDIPDEEVAPAVLQLDLSGASPLIQTLYAATRETKEDPTLARLEEAKRLIASGADVKATDKQGRTALHWVVFGSSYTTRPKLQVAYEEVADRLIDKGVEINREDAYNDTALDYLLYSPNFEMQTLLLENGATSGFLAAASHFYNESEMAPVGAPALPLKADLSPGKTLSIRLTVPVYSDRSRTGDPIEGVVTYPLCKSGEQIACEKGDLVVAPGTRVNGTVLFAQKAPNKYMRPRMVLDFSNIEHRSGKQSPLYARVLDVDNARETVRNNEIIGIVQPHASTKASFIMAAVSASNPIASYTVKGVQAVYGLSIRREILLPAGTDLQVQIVRASRLKEKDPWDGWPTIPVDAELRALVSAAPVRTHNSKQVPSDVTNLMFLGNQQQLEAAFAEAGWFQADDISMGSALKTVQATIRQTDYSRAPVSLLMVDNRPPDLVFQKSLDTFAKRHHLRVWKQPGTYRGQQIWVGAATHDIAISNERAGTKWSHRIDPHIDRERDWVETDLLVAGTGVGYADVDRPAAPRSAANATGDDIVTDGKMSVVALGPAKSPTGAMPTLTSRK